MVSSSRKTRPQGAAHGLPTMESDRLSGWKEIASHLRRSVRAAQRWEHELGLPVHRMKTAQGQVVFANRQELDEWMRRLETSPVVLGEAPFFPGEVPETTKAWLPRSQVILLCATVAAVVAAGAFVIARVLPSAGSDQVSRTTVQGRVIEARNETGQLLWSHDFGEDVSYLDLGTKVEYLTHSLATVDVNGDGSLDQVVPVRFSVGLQNFRKSDAVVAFSSDGTMLWSATIPVAETVQCGAQTFAGPWQLSAVLVSSDHGARRIWMAFNHHTDWPGVVIQVDATGARSVRYIQAGWIKSLAEDTTTGRRLVAAAGVLNAHSRASLTTFDPTQAVTVMSYADRDYSCAAQNSAPPVRVILFPQHDVTTGFGYRYHLATSVVPIGPGLRVTLDGTAVGLVDGDGRVSKLIFDDGYWVRHEAMSRAGRIRHSVADCPHLAEPQDIRTWTPEGNWIGYSVPPGTRPLGSPAQ